MTMSPGMVAIYVLVALPLPLLAVAWRRDDREKITFILLVLSAALLLSATVRSVKVGLLGPDHSARLFATIEGNMALVVLIGLYLAVTRRWLAASAAFLLAIGWLYVDVVNRALW